MDDVQIIELYWARNESAIEETDRKFGRYCRSIAYNILQNDSDAEECVNDTYLRAWNAIPPARPEKLSAFLGKITRNLALNRAEKLRAEKRGGGTVPAVLDELIGCIPDAAEGDMSDAIAIRDALNAFLRELPESGRAIFIKRYWYMCPINDIAEEYGMSESNVKTTLLRIRTKLKKHLEKEGISI